MTTSSGADKAVLIASLVLILVGGAVPASMLAVPAGVWLRWWPYGVGFTFLDLMHPWVVATAGIVLLLGILLYRKGQRLHAEFSVPFLWLHLLIVLGCAVAWFIPTPSQTERGRYPPLNDVSTDLVDIPRLVAIAGLRIDAPVLLADSSSGASPERTIQMQQEAYPDLLPHFYDTSVDDTYYLAYAAVLDMGWDVIAAVPEEGRIEASAKTFWFRLKEDVVIRIRSEDGKTRIDARSLSRVPGGDGGSNAKRLRTFFEKLEG